MNTDRDLVLELLGGGRMPVALASNPLARELEGEVLELAADPARTVLAFRPPDRFAQGAGVLQGGIIAALLDFAMALAAHAAVGRRELAFSTASLNVHFLRPAPPGRYVARGRIVRAGRRMLFAEADLFGTGKGSRPQRADPADSAAAPGLETATEGDRIATASAVMPVIER